MLEVIRQLRKPKLSDSSTVKGLSGDALRRAAGGRRHAVRRLGDSLEQLQELQEYDELRDALAQACGGRRRARAARTRAGCSRPAPRR